MEDVASIIVLDHDMRKIMVIESASSHIKNYTQLFKFNFKT